MATYGLYYREIIKESPEELLELINKYTDDTRYQRLRFLYLLKTGQIGCLVDGSKLVNRHPATTHEWLTIYKEKGIKALLLPPKEQYEENIKESPEELLELMKKPISLPSYQRLRALFLLKTGRFKKLSVLAEEMGYSVITVSGWWKKYCTDGIKGVIASPANGFREVSIPLPIEYILTLENWKAFTKWRDEQELTNELAINKLVELLLTEKAENNPEWLNQIIVDYKEEYRPIDIASDKIPVFLLPQQLSERLGVTSTILSRNRLRRTFSMWCKQRDPDSAAWKWNKAAKRYERVLTK